MTNQEQIFNNLMEYFKNTSDKDFVLFMNSFVFFKGVSNDEEGRRISKLLSKFLDDNDIVDTYMNYYYDVINTEITSFKRSNYSERIFIEDMFTCLFQISHNKLRDKVFEPIKVQKLPKVKKDKKVKANKVFIYDVDDETYGESHLVSPINSEYTICGMLIGGSFNGKFETTDKKVNCYHCSKTIELCKNI
jgi:hypothetical protein